MRQAARAFSNGQVFFFLFRTAHAQPMSDNNIIDTTMKGDFSNSRHAFFEKKKNNVFIYNAKYLYI